MRADLRRKLFNELPWMAFEFFLATHGAEVVRLPFKSYLELCCFFVKHSAAHIISQTITPHVLMKVQYKIEWFQQYLANTGDGTIL